MPEAILKVSRFQSFNVVRKRGGQKMARSYRDLFVWQKAKAFAVEIYRTTDRFPKREIYGITSQLRRASVSFASNIAEGQGRLTAGEFKQFLGHARGSLLEAETQLEIALELGYVAPEECLRLQKCSYEVLGLLNRLLESLHVKSRS